MSELLLSQIERKQSGKPYYILGILRPEHPTLFVAMPFDKEFRSLTYVCAYLPKDAYAFPDLVFAKAVMQQLIDGEKLSTSRASRLAYEFRKQTLAYEPYIDTQTQQPAANEPADWESKMIQGCEIYIQEITGDESRIIEKQPFTL